MYNPRTRPLDNTALALTNITCWANPPVVDQTIYRSYQMLNAIIPKIAKEPQRKVLPISAEAPSNPKIAMEIFMKLVAKQQEESSSVCADYLTAIETYKDAFKEYERQDLANQLPEQCPACSASGRHTTRLEENPASGSTTSLAPTSIQEGTSPVATAMNMDTSTYDANQDSRASENNSIAPDNDITMPPSSPEDMPASISQSEAADKELELSELTTVNHQELPSIDMQPETLDGTSQEQTD